MDQTHTYDLAFVAPQRRPRTAPEIVFIIGKQHLPEVIDRLPRMIRRFRGQIDAYLDDDDTDFTLPIPDIFNNQEFGYKRCGYWTVEGDSVHLRLQLRPYPWTSYCALTLFILTRVLAVPFEDQPTSNRVQPLDLQTSCEYRDAGYGHAIGGYVSAEVITWLRSYAAGKVRRLGIIEAAPMHPEVISATQAAWYAVSQPNLRKYASNRAIYGWIREEGAFSINCFGDACDLSIYPDAIGFRWDGYPVTLSCHNLDSANQQLALLAGLAKICQLARASS